MTTDRNDGLGFDVSAREDLDRGGRSESGRDLVTSAILHRITVDKLPLAESEEGFIDFGEDVRAWVGGSFSEATLGARAAGLAPIIERDPRVESATVEGRLARLPGALYDFELAISAQLKSGEIIDLVMGVSLVTVDLLAKGT